ncbi:hypothetical protein K439DRAFT_665456 [Ramaria rubella]|nr:hypothetical protein K439DRAFT_665456 [Ramaria rubella]
MRACVIKHSDKLELCAGPTADAKRKANEIIDIVNNPQFWNNVARMKIHLEPLAVAANITQAANTRLDHILITLANLFRIYGTMSDLERDVQETIQASLEKRWAKADQDIFILAVFFNPYIRASLFNPTIIQFTAAGIYGIIRRVFQRLYRKDSDYELHSAFMDYYKASAEFADDAMHLEVLEKAAKALKIEPNLVQLWEQLDTGANQGRNQLVKLAIRILSVVGNSAGCERLFSTMVTYIPSSVID